MRSQGFIEFVRKYYETEEFIPLHAPSFGDLERSRVLDAIDSTFVSTVGEYVNAVEKQLCELTGSAYAVATVNGTAALQVALRLSGVKQDTEVVTQPLSFVATANAIGYLGAFPVFLDVNRETFALCPDALQRFVDEHTAQQDGSCVNKRTGRTIAACAPMHTFGFAAQIEELLEICERNSIALVEDAAESLGSKIGDRHLGTFGQSGVISFNGNKVVTAGGGGMILTNDAAIAQQAKHLTTTAKTPHRWEYFHDFAGYNFRMPNLNAALLSGQLERIDQILSEKQRLADLYSEFCRDNSVEMVSERVGTRANHWLNTFVMKDKAERDEFLRETNEAGVMTRPAWHLLSDLPMYLDCFRDELIVSKDFSQRLVNVPSSPRLVA